jgi:hypothetical protein
MIVKFGWLTAFGLIFGLLACYWVEPNTSAGQVLLVIIVVCIVNGIGGVLWKRKPAGPSSP